MEIKYDETNQLVSQARSGCPNSLDMLFREQRPKLHRFIRNRVSRQEDIEDLVQDTFLWAQQGLSSFEGKSRFSTWILGIANNLIRNHYNRSPEYKYDFVSDDVLDQAHNESDTPEASLQQEHRIKQLEYSIRMLPKDVQQIVEWVAIENYPYQRVADELGITVPSVKSRLFRARTSLKESVMPLM
ncbi:RNA polymerase sigma factor [Hahella sp. CR1]|uniref:RNA polymerase sigma factor n=1 Tax=unclassified Hahella TaxID=2624107 RepID=UPI002443322F|nr:sigma-70 family RNA polymerase sigma factor [Hahella sp. CR1]MDG9668375.1 sigma-70 family RNA polymerase sigma factor [Hahella sp. CR1]